MKHTFTIPTNVKAGELYLITVELDSTKFIEIVDIVSTFKGLKDFYNADKKGLFKVKFMSYEREQKIILLEQ